MCKEVEMIFLLVLAFSISSQVTVSTPPVKLQFLKGITRLNKTSYTDFYFFCSVKGQFLLWKLNNERLTAFEVNDLVGQSLVNERFDYVYTGTLLSSEPAENDHRIMGSIIVVSFKSSNPSNFEVTCSNGSHSQTTMAGAVTGAVNSSVMFDSNPNIILDYISSSAIVGNRHMHIFMCGANYSTQVLQINDVRLAFRSVETLGNYRVASASTYTINEQGILVAREPVQIVSILIVALDTDVEVICYNGNIQTRLRSNMTLDAEWRNSMESVTQTSESTDEISESAISSPAEEEAKPTAASTTIAETTPQDRIDDKSSTKMNKNHKLVYAVTTTIVILIVVFTVVSIVIFIWYCRAAKHMSKVFNVVLSDDYVPSVKQENNFGNKEKQASFRDTSSRKQINSNKMRPAVKPFSRNRGLKVKTSQIQAIHEGGSQFAGITTGKSMKQVYVKSDGETFESTEKTEDEEDQCRRRHNARCQSESIPRSVSLTRAFS